jgi:hypothetical protein
VYQSFSIGASNSLDFGMSSTSCGNTNSGGTINVSIFSGTPPFTYQWSDNVPITESGPSISNLTGGTYSLTVLDSSNCILTRNVTVPCTPFINDYQVIPIISSGFTTTVNNKRDFETMVNEGFYDLTTGNTNCVLVSAVYAATIEISGNTYEQNFYTGTTLTDVPTESEWVDALESILSGITGVLSYTVNPSTNTVEVKSFCDGNEDTLSDSEFIMGLRIQYNIICES